MVGGGRSIDGVGCSAKHGRTPNTSATVTISDGSLPFVNRTAVESQIQSDAVPVFVLTPSVHYDAGRFTVVRWTRV